MAQQIQTVVNDASVDAFLALQADPQRRADCDTIVHLMQRATGEPPRMWGPAIVGCGKYRYRYDSGRAGEMPVIAFSPRKNDLTLYIQPGIANLEDMLSRLGRHKTAKVCLYIKRLADVDLAVLAEIIGASVDAMAPQRVHPPGASA